MRVVGVRMGDERYRFVWSIHHLIEDAWSISVLMKEVLAAYHARADRIAGPPPRAVSRFRGLAQAAGLWGRRKPSGVSICGAGTR